MSKQHNKTLAATLGMLAAVAQFIRPAASWVANIMRWYANHKPEVDAAAAALAKFQLAAADMGPHEVETLRRIQHRAAAREV